MSAEKINHVNLLKNNAPKIMRYLPIYVLCMLISLSIAYVFLRYSKPVYKVSAWLLMSDDKTKNLQLSIDATKDAVKDADRYIEDLSDLKIRSAVLNAVRDLNLTIDYKKKGQLTNTDLYNKAPVKFQLVRIGSAASIKLLVSIKNNNTYLLKIADSKAGEYTFNSVYTGEFGSWVISKTPEFNKYIGSNIIIDVQDQESATEKLLAKIDVKRPGKDKNIIELSIEDKVLTRAEDVLKQIPLELNEVSKQETEASSITEMKLLEERISALSVQVDMLQEEVSTISPAEMSLILTPESLKNLALIKKNDELINDISFQLKVINELARYTRYQDFMHASPPSISSISNPALEGLFQQVSMIQSQYRQLSETHLITEPVFDPLRKQSDQLKSAIMQSFIETKASLIKKQSLLNAANNRFEAFVSQLPARERKIVILKRKQHASENLYAYLSLRKESAALHHLIGAGTSSIIKSKYEVDINKKAIYTSAALIGLLLPTLLITIQRMTKKTNLQPTI